MHKKNNSQLIAPYTALTVPQVEEIFTALATGKLNAQQVQAAQLGDRCVLQEVFPEFLLMYRSVKRDSCTKKHWDRFSANCPGARRCTYSLP